MKFLLKKFAETLLVAAVILFILVVSTQNSEKRIEKHSTPSNLPLRSVQQKLSLPSASSSSTPLPAPGAKYIYTNVTFYGFADNDPPSKNIAYPANRFSQALHSEAGGTGSYDDPITFASDPDEWPIGTKMYVPYLKKYLLMEDWCSTCVSKWKEVQKKQIDIWIDSDQSHAQELLDCEDHWTRRRARVEVDPPKGREVSKTPFFDKESGKCF